MNLKLLFFCLFLAVLLVPAELKHKKDDKHDQHHYRGHGDHGHRDHGHRGHGHRGHGHGHGKGEKKGGRFKDIVEDDFFKVIEGTVGDDDDDDDQGNSDWLLELQNPAGRCNPNPCLNNGVCEEKGKNNFKCDCPRPFKGRKCEKGPKVCWKGRCGRGECVRIPNPPFYECKCKAPFQPPDCRHYEVCEPNPCRNGGQCIKDGKDFDCQCPPGYRGRFCHVGPDDCFVDDGESYRGNVSETDDGDECLYWNSHFLLENGADPFSSFADKDGLGPHNFCRNPDGDSMPWCFFRRGRRLLWDYCDVTKCPVPTGVVPTEVIPTVPHSTSAEPQPTKPEPTADPKPTTTKMPTTTTTPVTEKPSQAPEPSAAPTDGSIHPTATVPPQQFATCGKPQPKRPIIRIFGGLKVAPGAIPWQVSVQVRPENTSQPFSHICGGVLIASCWVLTAGHCIEQRKDMQVVMGGLSLDMPEHTEQTLRVEQAILHENYKETPASVFNDIALLRLSGTNGVCAIESQFVKAACLPDGQLPDGMECTISGWGITEDSQHGSNHLLKANVLLISQEKCTEPGVYGKNLDHTMFCAGHLQGGVDSCQGDSGGPLTCKQNDTSVVYGLVSWGDQCGRKNKPGVYTRVSQFVNWIKAKTQATFP
ncbi:hyaluronan-binding protein 2 [Lates calcarifer]|uniref:trypsin n=1 Tax=Lates calcarifer TaxID=8187 RepID=A0A4W6CCQ7_LATCA|nr:hyaluronan-binding protein 2 [Lates calcarifer]